VISFHWCKKEVAMCHIHLSNEAHVHIHIC
jgi:hypothetical protein